MKWFSPLSFAQGASERNPVDHGQPETGFVKDTPFNYCVRRFVFFSGGGRRRKRLQRGFDSGAQGVGAAFRRSFLRGRFRRGTRTGDFLFKRGLQAFVFFKGENPAQISLG